MSVSNDFLDYVLDQFSGWGEVTVKRMFGGAGLYCDGFAFALVANDIVYLKVDDTNIRKFVEQGSSPLKPFSSDATVKSFYNIPDNIFENREEFIEWADESLSIQKKRNNY